MIQYVCLLFLILFSSCGKQEPVQRQTARFALTADPTMLDPRKARDLDGVTIIHMLFEGLTRTSRTGEPELALAKSVEISDDGLRYVFHLRKSFWSNGDRLTAHDFCNSWRTILDPKFPTDIAYQLYPIKNARKSKLGELGVETVGVQALDEQTLVVELEQPVPYFLELVTMTSFFPVPIKVVENEQWHLTPETLVSNGPFTLKTWNHSNQLTMSKNLRYWEASEVKLTSVDLYIATPDTALQMFEEGKLDWTGSPLSMIPADAIRELKKSQRLQISPFLATYFYRVNTNPLIGNKSNPLADANFRRALSFAIDRNAIVTHVLQGGHTAAMSLIPPEMRLKGGGYSSGEAPNFPALDEPITISYSNTERNASVAQSVQKQWESALGIHVRLEAVEPKVFFQRVSKREYQIAAGSWSADFNDPVNFLEVFKYKEGSTNNTGWESAEYVDLLNRSAICKPGEERDQVMRKAEAILMEQLPIIPVFHFVLNYVKKPELEGVALSPSGQLDLRWAYFKPTSRTAGEKR